MAVLTSRPGESLSDALKEQSRSITAPGETPALADTDIELSFRVGTEQFVVSPDGATTAVSEKAERSTALEKDLRDLHAPLQIKLDASFQGAFPYNNELAVEPMEDCIAEVPRDAVHVEIDGRCRVADRSIEILLSRAKIIGKNPEDNHITLFDNAPAVVAPNAFLGVLAA